MRRARLPAGGGADSRAQMLLLTGLTLSFTLLLIGTNLAPNRSQGIEPGRTSNLAYGLANLEHEFPLALSAALAANPEQGLEANVTLTSLFDETANSFERAFAYQGLALDIRLASINQSRGLFFTLNWAYHLADEKTPLTINASGTYRLDYGDDWWSSQWPYRYGVDVSLPHESLPTPVSITVNFTQELARLGIVGSLDSTSLRVVAQNLSAKTQKELVWGFVASSGYHSSTNATGELYWVSQPGFSRYFIYFDLVGNSKAKPEPPKGNLALNSTTGRVTNSYYFDWVFADNSHFRLRQTFVVNDASRGWLFNNTPGNWTKFQLVTDNEALKVLLVSNGTLQRRYTFFDGTPLIRWEVVGAPALVGFHTRPFTTLTNDSTGNMDYYLAGRQGAYLAVLVAAGENLTTAGNASATALVSSAANGYLLMGEDTAGATVRLEETVANLNNMTVKGLNIHRLKV